MDMPTPVLIFLAMLIGLIAYLWLAIPIWVLISALIVLCIGLFVVLDARARIRTRRPRRRPLVLNSDETSQDHEEPSDED